MRKYVSLLLTALWVGLSAPAITQELPMSLNLMPQPAQFAAQTGQFRLQETFTIAVTGQPEARLYRAATRALRRLAGRTGLFLTQDLVRPGFPSDSAQLVIHCERPGQVRFGEDESYTLIVTPKIIRLHAATDIGGLRGLETLLQLLAADENGYFVPAVTIVDKPRFPWRGLLIDACRHFMPVEVILRNLDGMAAVKMNVLHWHLSED